MRYPNDAALAADATRVLAREAEKVIGLGGAGARAVRRPLPLGRPQVARDQPHRRAAHRRGQDHGAAGSRGEAGELVKQSVARDAATGDAAARAGARPRRQGQAGRRRRLEELADRAEKVARQIDQRLAGEKITDRLVSMFDPDARPIRKGKLRSPTEFGYVFQLAEITENTRRGARGLLLPAATELGSPKRRRRCWPRPPTSSNGSASGRATSRSTAASHPGPATDRAARQRARVHRRPPIRRLAAQPTAGWRSTASAAKAASATSNAATAPAEPASKAIAGARTTVGWAILAYNLDTLAIRTA